MVPVPQGTITRCFFVGLGSSSPASHHSGNVAPISEESPHPSSRAPCNTASTQGIPSPSAAQGGAQQDAATSSQIVSQPASPSPPLSTMAIPHIDLIATTQLAKCKSFTSRYPHPKSTGNALWINLLGIFPPFPLLPYVVRKLRQTCLTLILVTPTWARQPSS